MPAGVQWGGPPGPRGSPWTRSAFGINSCRTRVAGQAVYSLSDRGQRQRSTAPHPGSRLRAPPSHATISSLNISVKGEYALQALFDLASQPPGEPVKIAEVAGRQKIPQKFLELILAGLKQGGFVESRRGAEGGYLLARPADQITVGEVLRFFEGGQNGKSRLKRAGGNPFEDM